MTDVVEILPPEVLVVEIYPIGLQGPPGDATGDIDLGTFN